MIFTRGKNVISIRDITFDGCVDYEFNARRDSSVIKVHYQILTKEISREDETLEMSARWVVVSDKVLTVNSQFGDLKLIELMAHVKKFAVELISETNLREGKEIEDAIDKINQTSGENSTVS